MRYRASIIISIYNNIDALRLILHALSLQSEKDFEIIVSEDGESPRVREFIDTIKADFPNLIHNTQADEGFRKNTALNRAILAAHAEYLIFIDGDCVPHPHFIASHVNNASRGQVCSGRRAEFGKRLSRFILQRPQWFSALINPIVYSALTVPGLLDGAKNYEAGLYSKFLHRRTQHKQPGILGCNFSAYRQDLLRVNGFNEDYTSPAIGEDADLEWRLRQLGVTVKNIKFLAPVYHLYHEHKFQASSANKAIMEDTIKHKKIVCEHGIRQHGGS
jgi:glycosyltransferase involved in cell wall biosynthesis